MRPRELHAAGQRARFRDDVPAPPASVLDVGCGPGYLAAELLSAGYDVTAIDPDSEAVEACRGRGVPALEAGLDEVDAGPFDVVICSRSLHHIPDLSTAVADLSRLLRPGGVLVLDEFDHKVADPATAAWFYGTLRLLETAGVAADTDPSPPADPLERWRRDHAHEPRLHPGADMLDALRRGFDVQSVERSEALWIYLCQWVDDTDDGGRVAAELRELERSLIETGAVVPIGLRVIARHRA